MNNSNKQSVRQDERGFASIVIALVLITVLSLLTIAFAQLARREQRNALDKQLAIQAYYAAESGVNDAIKALPTIAAASPRPDPNQCLPASYLPNNGVLNSTYGVSYSCVLVDMQLPNILFSGVGPEAARNSTFTLNGNLNRLTVSWSSGDGVNTFCTLSCGQFSKASPAPGNWRWPAVVQFTLTPLPGFAGSTTTDRNNLINNSFSVYLFPSTNGGSVTFDTSKQGQIIGGNCSNSGDFQCNVTINGIPASSNGYLVHAVNYYDKSTISINNARDASNVQLDFTDGQAQIDATGKAKTVLKRIQVRVPLTPVGETPPYGLEGQSICKRFGTYSGSDTASAPSGFGANTCDVWHQW
jgi:hypothetical protein